MPRCLSLLAIAFASLAAAPASAILTTFDSPVVTGPSQAPGVWYTDRYAPAGFTSPEFFDGDNRLKQSIAVADGENNRTGFAGGFYNTQGRKYDIDGGAGQMSIDLYIPADWETTGLRMAGFWGTAFDTGVISSYPIIEFESDGTSGQFRAWDSGAAGFVDMGLPTGFTYDAWYTLGIELTTGGDFVYSVGDLTASVDALGSENIGNVILQGHNTDVGVDYDIYWDNFNFEPGLTMSDIPEPTSLLFGAAITCGFALRGRRNERDLEA